MARVTPTEVKTIMDNCTLTDPVILTFILASNQVVTKVFGYSATEDTLYKEIERWLTAHMIASTISRTTSDEKIGDVSVKYTGQWGKNLDSTPYGQMVKVLDTSGKISNLGKGEATIYAVKSFDE
jgi:hypothetical protein